jgi:hypothetical protein
MHLQSRCSKMHLQGRCSKTHQYVLAAYCGTYDCSIGMGASL